MNDGWLWGANPVEAWSPIGELREEVPEHVRLMTTAYNLMMGKFTAREYVKDLPTRDANDVVVLRKMR